MRYLSGNVVPNILSLSRIPAAGIFLVTYSTVNLRGYSIAMAAAVYAIISDVLDGYLARRWQLKSQAGYFLDGIGDKAFNAAVLLVMLREAESNLILVWLLLFRETLLYGLRGLDSEMWRDIERLRPFSRSNALCIRLYFLCFVAKGGLTLAGYQLPSWYAYSQIFGYAALVLGYVSIVFLAKKIIDKP